MFHLHKSLRYYLFPAPVDMRKSFYTLRGIVTSSMRRNVLSGEVFILVNRHQTIMKVLHMEYDGMVIYHKELDGGRFKMPHLDKYASSLNLDWEELIMMIRQVKPIRKRLQKKYQTP